MSQKSGTSRPIANHVPSDPELKKTWTGRACLGATQVDELCLEFKTEGLKDKKSRSTELSNAHNFFTYDILIERGPSGMAEYRFP